MILRTPAFLKNQQKPQAVIIENGHGSETDNRAIMVQDSVSGQRITVDIAKDSKIPQLEGLVKCVRYKVGALSSRAPRSSVNRPKCITWGYKLRLSRSNLNFTFARLSQTLRVLLGVSYLVQ